MAITVIQDAANTSAATTSLVVTLNAPCRGGSGLIAIITTPSVTVSSVAGCGATWARTTGSSTTGSTIDIWIGHNATAGGTTVTITIASSAVIATVIEAIGLPTSGSQDVTGSQSGAATMPAAPTNTSTQAGDLVVACASWNTVSSTLVSETAGWKSIAPRTVSTVSQAVSYQVMDAAGTTPAETWTLTANAANYISAIGAYKDANIVKRFYFHDATSGNTGTLPGSTDLDSGTTPDVTAATAATNRSMTPTIGTSQVSQALTTLANTLSQSGWFRRFLSAPLAAQSLGQQALNLHVGMSVSNTNSNLFEAFGVYVWRPSTGALVGTYYAVDATAASTAAGTTESALGMSSLSSFSTAQTVLDGDILVCEVWRSRRAQAMGTAYTNTFFYDGTTVDSTTSNAAYLEFGGSGVVMQATATPIPKSEQLRQAVNRAANFAPRDDGLYVPDPHIWLPGGLDHAIV